MLRASLVLGLLAPLSALAPAPKGGSSTSRRSALTSTLAALSTATLIQPSVRAEAVAAAEAAEAAPAAESPIDVYFGCGCFWHVQHEFVEAERRILSRGDLALTSYAGYAGGKAGAKDGKVCYHNAAQISDYGSLGHGEVVRMSIPPSAFPEFAREYCKLFDKNGYRPDQMGDRGSEYRNLVGIPGGVNSPLAKQLVAASVAEGDKLDFAAGKGDDDDVRGLVWLMDTQKFPFYMGEAYHQFHDGFNWGEDYPGSYNGLAKKQIKAGLFKDKGCPNGMIGIGIAGL